MARKHKRRPSKPKSHKLYIDRDAVRNWKEYTVKLDDGSYYNGISSFKDPSKRISQHGGARGAKWTHGKKVVEVIATRTLGRMSYRQAETIENQTTLSNRRKYGYRRVRGGYNSQLKASLIPNYTPGSIEWLVFMLICLALVFGLIWIIVERITYT